MATTILGQVRDKITSIDLTSTSGRVKTYTVKTECSPSGAGTFTVTDGQDGQNGANGYRISISSEIAGSNLLTTINTIKISNLLAILGRPAGSPVGATFKQYNWSAALSTAPNSSSVVASSLRLYDGEGTELTGYDSYQFSLIYVDDGDVNTQCGYDFGDAYSSETALLNAALDLYKANFADTVSTYPFAFGKLTSSFYFVYPNSVSTTGPNAYQAQFTVINSQGIHTAQTTDSGSTWTFGYNATVKDLGTFNTTIDAILTAAYNFYASASTDRSAYPIAVAYYAGEFLQIEPSIINSSSDSATFIVNSPNFGGIYTTSDGGVNWSQTEAQYFHDFGTFANETPMFVDIANSSVYRGAGKGQKIKSVARVYSSSSPTKCYTFEYANYYFDGEWDIRFESQYESGILHVSKNPVTSVISWSTEYFSNKTKSLGTFGSRAAALSAAYMFFSNATNWFNFSVVYAMTSAGKEITIFRPSHYSAASTLWIIDPAKQYGFATTSDNGSTWTVKFYQDELDTKLTKGDYDATTGVGYADLANNLTPYSDESGSEQSKPFVAQGTATDNGTAIVTVGSFAQLKEKQGNTVAWNQIVYNSEFGTSSGWQAVNGTLQVSDNTAEVTVGSTPSTEGIFQYIDTVSGHDYLAIAKVMVPRNVTMRIVLSNGGTGNELTKALNANEWTDIFGIISATSSWTRFYVLDVNGSGLQASDVIKFKIATLTDLTQLFPISTPTSATDPRVIWAIQYATLHHEYNAGSLINGDGVKLVCTGRQLWDEELENYYYFKPADGTKITSLYWSCSKNRIKCVPNATYYFYYGGEASIKILFYDANDNYLGEETAVEQSANTTFNAPFNACYMRFDIGITIAYNHDITISLYYTPQQGGDGYDQYYPYEEPTITDTGSEVLRSAGSAHDVKKPSGEITRSAIEIDLASQDWTYDSTYGTWTSQGIASIKPAPSLFDIANFSCEKYEVTSSAYVLGIGGATQKSNSIAINNGTTPNFNVNNGSSTTKPSGYVICELATPTTEQGTPFPENVVVDDYGMMYWLKANDDPAEIPQGSLFFYPSDYKGLLDDIYSMTNGDAQALVTESELSASETARDAVDAQLKEALGGTLRQLLAVSKSIDFANTDVKDLGDLTWVYQSAYNVFYSDSLASVIKRPPNINTAANVLSTRFSTKSQEQVSNVGLDVGVTAGEGRLYTSNPEGLTNVNAFKAYVKGVLLAYEKA